MNLTLGSLNFQDAGNWPNWQKAAVCAGILAFVVVVGALWIVFGEEMPNRLEQGEREEIRLKANYTERKIKTINHDLYIEQLDQIQREFGALVKKLPGRSEIDALLVDVNQAGIARGLQFDLFRPAQQERKSGFYAEIPINIKLTGDYHGMGGFVSDVAALPRVVTVSDISLAHNKGVLTMEAVAKTFRYLDEKELAEQRAQQ
ncbi:MAG: type 4a pilus biogenesis protein PilO [Proteobacteria bacterium]|nr:type 4a pilus biogenesis protein PilO [Pseudomonadota bacterium]MCL2307212.1 type 4a pilus biogenesis protein PilO [Pseudomonadota bacterium]